MAVVVELAFTGICAFVESSDGGYAAVMPNARHHPHMPHIPWMIVNSKYYNGPFNRKSGDLRAVYLPDGDFRVDGAAKGPIAYQPPATSARRPAPGTARSCHWIAPFPAILQAEPELDPDFLTPGEANRVSLWCSLPGGTLSTSAVLDNVWALQSESDPNPTVTQSLAQEVSLTFSLPDTEVITIDDHEWDHRKFKIYPFHLRGDKHLRILLGNTPESDVFPAGHGPEPVDEHFRIYYDMFKTPTPPRDQRIPHAVAVTKASKIFRVVSRRPWAVDRLNGMNCPPAFMYTIAPGKKRKGPGKGSR
jgi:hypothetical protein